MLKVLHFFKTYIPDTYGGTESFIFELCENKFTKNYKSDVLHISPRGSSDYEPINEHFVHRAKRNVQLFSTDISIEALFKLKKLAKEYDIIHVHSPWPFMDLALFICQINKPIVLTYHSDIIRQKNLAKIYYPLMIYMLNKVDKIIATSPNYVQTSTILQRYREKVVTIPFGLNRNNYITTDKKVQYWKNRFNNRFLLFVGKLRYYKGLNFLLDAVKNSDIPIVIAGNDGDEKNLKKYAQRLNLNNVHFLGEITNEDKVALLQLCYAFIFPSHLRSEAFGISLLEAAMFGKAMITCDIGTGSSYVNIDGETGLHAKPKDPADLRKKIDFLYAHPEQTNIMGQNAMKRFDHLFNIEDMITSYGNLYQQVFTDFHT